MIIQFNRKEAKDELGLHVEKPNDELYSVIKAVYQDIEVELELRNPFNPNVLLGTKNPYQYAIRRALIESVAGGTDVFISEGTLTKHALATGQIAMQDNRTLDGWRHEN